MSTDRVLIQLIRNAFPFDGSAVQAFDASAVDWQNVIERANRHGIAPLLYSALKKLAPQTQVPADVLESLRMSYLRADVASWQAYQELGRLLDLFLREQIPIVLLKGCALGPTLYADVNLRQLGDLDLLIPESAKERVSVLMSAQGYSPSLELADDFGNRFASEQCFVRRGAQTAQADIHWHIFNLPYFRKHIPIEWFWRRMVVVDINGREAQIFSPEAQVLHLAFHWWMHHHGHGLKWSHDIALLLSCYRDQMNWDDVIAAGHAFGLTQLLRATLTQVTSTWGVDVPENIFAKLHPSLQERVSFALLTAQQTEARVVWDGWSAGGVRSRVAYLFQIFFPSPTFMRSRYNIDSPQLLPLYYGWRLLLGLYRFTSSAASMLANIFRMVTHKQHA